MKFTMFMFFVPYSPSIWGSNISILLRSWRTSGRESWRNSGSLFGALGSPEGWMVNSEKVADWHHQCHSIHTGWWWLEHVFFSHILGIVILIDSYFSGGFKPPTSIQRYTLWLCQNIYGKYGHLWWIVPWTIMIFHSYVTNYQRVVSIVSMVLGVLYKNHSQPIL